VGGLFSKVDAQGKADMFSLGILIFEMWHAPFETLMEVCICRSTCRSVLQRSRPSWRCVYVVVLAGVYYSVAYMRDLWMNLKLPFCYHPVFNTHVSLSRSTSPFFPLLSACTYSHAPPRTDRGRAIQRCVDAYTIEWLI
jgi:hypothetical protein